MLSAHVVSQNSCRSSSLHPMICSSLLSMPNSNIKQRCSGETEKTMGLERLCLDPHCKVYTDKLFISCSPSFHVSKAHMVITHKAGLLHDLLAMPYTKGLEHSDCRLCNYRQMLTTLLAREFGGALGHIWGHYNTRLLCSRWHQSLSMFLQRNVLHSLYDTKQLTLSS